MSLARAARRSSLQDAIDRAAHALREGAPAFTRRNLFFATRRAGVPELSEARFDAGLDERLARGAVPGLVRARRPARPAAARDAFPSAVLLVDRHELVELFVALAQDGPILPRDLAVVGVDGRPAANVAALVRGFRGGRRAPVLYLHDGATTVYPFAIEPLATLVALEEPRAIAFRDLGLPPLGTRARRFGDASMPDDELVLELEVVPPASLARHVAKALVARAARLEKEEA